MQDNRKILSKYRLETAMDDYLSAKESFSNKRYRTTANRAYYCVLHTMRALLIISGQDYKSHSAVISYFRKEYVKTGIFDAVLSDIINRTQTEREDSDYSDLVDTSREEAKIQLDNAKIFYKTVASYIETKYYEHGIMPPCQT
jgi:uncharacterized protein (UPF0332 family)